MGGCFLHALLSRIKPLDHILIGSLSILIVYLIAKKKLIYFLKTIGHGFIKIALINESNWNLMYQSKIAEIIISYTFLFYNIFP